MTLIEKTDHENNTSTEKLLIKLGEKLDELKAENILILDLRETNSYLNYFLMVNAQSNLHIKKLSQEIKKYLKEKNIVQIYSHEPDFKSGWEVLDFGELLIHFFMPDARERYNLEELWSEARIIDWEK